MENKKKDLAKIALTAFLLAAAAPASVAAAPNAAEAPGTFLAAGCASCGAHKKGQLADNTCGARRAPTPQNASCAAQRGTIADNSCGAKRSNAPQSASCGAQRGTIAENSCGAKHPSYSQVVCGAARNYTADNTAGGDMYDPSSHSYQTGGQPTQQGQNPYGAPNAQGNQNRMNNPNRGNNPNNQMQGRPGNPNQMPSGENTRGSSNY